MPRISHIALLLIAFGCRNQPDTSGETATLLNTDREWAKISSSGSNADSVVSFWTDDARFATPGAPDVRGKSALKEMVTRSFAAPGFHINWTPESAVVAASGDLGYTTGTNEMSVPDSTGKITKLAGRYITVWRRDSGGRWRCAEDYSTLSPVRTPPRA